MNGLLYIGVVARWPLVVGEQASRAVWYFTLPSAPDPTAIPFTSLSTRSGSDNTDESGASGCNRIIGRSGRIVIGWEPNFHPPSRRQSIIDINLLSGFFSLQVLRCSRTPVRGLSCTVEQSQAPTIRFSSRSSSNNEKTPFLIWPRQGALRSLFIFFPGSFFSVTTSSQPGLDLCCASSVSYQGPYPRGPIATMDHPCITPTAMNYPDQTTNWPWDGTRARPWTGRNQRHYLS